MTLRHQVNDNNNMKEDTSTKYTYVPRFTAYDGHPGPWGFLGPSDLRG